ADAAMAAIVEVAPTASLEVLPVDLADLDSVAAAAEQFRAGHDRLDVLVNNAGLMALPHQRTVQGFEMQLGVNHLAAFALTGHLLDRILATPAARVVAISSQGHRPGTIHFDDLQLEQHYGPWVAYFQSKLANLLFTFELQRRLAAKRASAIAVAAHPGGSRTNLGHENPGGIVNTVGDKIRPVINFVMQPAAMGALPTLRAATDPAVKGGEYYGPDGLWQQRGYPKRVGSTKRAHDPVAAARLWAVSAELTGVSFGALE
ncbi:MAG: SDR family NAD(P)-dependent oxidoreductase, partial [Acidimicrobiia bacterium]|nr:SDR family NAD(P)-dependent oxidoreductase [Acidimicrobiia bacterium]